MKFRRSLTSQTITAIIALIVLLACGRFTGARQTPPVDTQPAVVSEADEVQSNDNFLFEDDFQDGQPEEWTINSSWYVQQDGDVYVFSATDLGGAYVTQGRQWTDTIFQADCRIINGNLVLSTSLSQEGRYGLRMGADGVYLMKEQPVGTYLVLAEAGPITVDDWHHVSFANQAGHLQVSIDQVLWFDWVDSDAHARGTVAVSALSGSTVEVDNVLVSRIDGSLSSGVPQAPPPLEDSPTAEEVVQQAVPELPEIETDREIQNDHAQVDEPDDVPEEIQQDEPDEPEDVGDEEHFDENPPVVEDISLPDLVITGITFDPDPVIQGEPFTTNYMIQNQGEAAAGAFTLRIHFHAAAGITDCNWDISALDAGAVAWGGCVKTTNAPAGDSPVRGTIDVEGDVREIYEDNNELSQTLTIAVP